MTHKVETLIIGAGVVGSSVAMHLAKKGMRDIRVVDFDLEGNCSSSELNAGGVRATWNQSVNIEMAKISIDYFATIAEDVGYRACGYLWLHTSEALAAALKGREKQVSMGWPVEVWDLAELKRRVPFIDKTDGIAGVTFGSRDGLVNPNLLKNHYRAEARKLGVVFDDRILVRQTEYGSEDVRVIAERYPQGPMAVETKQEILTDQPTNLAKEKIQYRAQRVINCAGAWASDLAKVLKYPCPSIALRRQNCIFDCREVDLTQYGMIVDTSGVYFHPEATNGLAGFATPNEPTGKNYSYDGESFFMEQIWPPLYERSTAFEKLKHITGWAGLYEVSPDDSGIIGEVKLGEAGKSGRVFEAHSFSGHGVMHSHSTGLSLAELVVDGRYQSMDISLLNGNRFELGRLVLESALI